VVDFWVVQEFGAKKSKKKLGGVGVKHKAFRFFQGCGGRTSVGSGHVSKRGCTRAAIWDIMGGPRVSG